jgi:hypothetical protein
MGIFHYKEAGEEMEDKKLTAIISAITAYIQMEQKPPQVAPHVKPRTEQNGGKFPKDGS